MRTASTFLCAFATTAMANYELISQYYTADPAPFVYNGRVYLITTHDPVGQRGWDMTDYVCLSSSDLLNWRDEGIAYSKSQSPFAVYMWAQQVVIKNGKFYMYYPGMAASGSFGVAVASSPCGPYVDISPNKRPIMGGDDPTALVDPDTGTVFFCANDGGGPNCTTMKDDMVTFATKPVVLPFPNWFEAPWLTKLSGPNGTWYYLSYMCQGTTGTGWREHFGFDICYSRLVGGACFCT